jgi:hypothetical protein
MYSDLRIFQGFVWSSTLPVTGLCITVSNVTNNSSVVVSSDDDDNNDDDHDDNDDSDDGNINQNEEIATANSYMVICQGDDKKDKGAVVVPQSPPHTPSPSSYGQQLQHTSVIPPMMQPRLRYSSRPTRQPRVSYVGMC